MPQQSNSTQMTTLGTPAISHPRAVPRQNRPLVPHRCGRVRRRRASVLAALRAPMTIARPARHTTLDGAMTMAVRRQQPAMSAMRRAAARTCGTRRTSWTTRFGRSAWQGAHRRTAAMAPKLQVSMQIPADGMLVVNGECSKAYAATGYN